MLPFSPNGDGAAWLPSRVRRLRRLVTVTALRFHFGRRRFRRLVTATVPVLQPSAPHNARTTDALRERWVNRNQILGRIARSVVTKTRSQKQKRAWGRWAVGPFHSAFDTRESLRSSRGFVKVYFAFAGRRRISKVQPTACAYRSSVCTVGEGRLRSLRSKRAMAGVFVPMRRATSAWVRPARRRARKSSSNRANSSRSALYSARTAGLLSMVRTSSSCVFTVLHLFQASPGDLQFLNRRCSNA
jgi:hypothetical protein